MAAGTATLENTIVSNNSSPSDPMHPNCSGVIASLGHNLEDALDCGFTATGDIQGQDPALGKLGNYGGQTDTHSLDPRSPALDRANNAVCLAADQRGFFRPQGGVCDIGAFELDQPPNTTFTGGPANPTPTNDTTPTFTFTSNEPGQFFCSIDGGEDLLARARSRPRRWPPAPTRSTSRPRTSRRTSSRRRRGATSPST